MSDLRVSIAAKAAGMSEMTVVLLATGGEALLTAGEVARIAGKLAGSGEAVGEAGTMPGTSGFTMACFRADAVPAGTKLYAAPTDAQSRIAELEAQLADRDAEIVRVHNEHQLLCGAKLSALEAKLTESREREGRMRNMLTDIYDVNRDVPDAIDNDGKPYQSEYLASQLAALAAEKE